MSAPICSTALAHIGKPPIQLLTEDSTEAKLCNAFYARALQSLLVEHAWRFAMKSVALALLEEDGPDGWTYRYAYPSDCLRAIEVYTSVDVPSAPTIPWTVELSSTDLRTILSNDTGLNLRYTSNVTDTNLFSPKFRETLEYKLANMLAMPLTGDESLVRYTKQLEVLTLVQAKVNDANEGRAQAKPLTQAILSRR